MGIRGLVFLQETTFLTEEYLLARENENHAKYLEELEARITADVWTHSERMRARRSGDAEESVDGELEDWDADDEDGEGNEEGKDRC